MSGLWPGEPVLWRGSRERGSRERVSRERVSRERGSAGVWLLGLCAVLGLAVTAGVLIGAGAVARHRAAAAADLSALAAAGRALEGTAVGCAAAADVVAGMGAELADCQISADIAEVRVRVTVRLGGLGVGAAEARARAGPV